MRTSEVEVGKTYLCYIGEELARVVVTGHVPGRVPFGSRSGRCSAEKFTVRREGEAKDLPKKRSAAALRVTTEDVRDMVTAVHREQARTWEDTCRE